MYDVPNIVFYFVLCKNKNKRTKTWIDRKQGITKPHPNNMRFKNRIRQEFFIQTEKKRKEAKKKRFKIPSDNQTIPLTPFIKLNYAS